MQNYYDFIAKKNEQVNIEYSSELDQGSFLDLLSVNRQKDKILTFTSSGIHRDDFIFKINSNSLKKSGSQGQQKTFLIALKFAYFDLLKKRIALEISLTSLKGEVTSKSTTVSMFSQEKINNKKSILKQFFFIV